MSHHSSHITGASDIFATSDSTISFQLAVAEALWQPLLLVLQTALARTEEEVLWTASRRKDKGKAIHRNKGDEMGGMTYDSQKEEGVERIVEV